MAKNIKEFPYEKTLKTNPQDTFLNFQHYLLITSKQITKILYFTPVTPHQVILFSLIIGVLSSYLIIQNNKLVVIIGAVLLFYKNVLDKVDGSLARAKGLASRRGRFYDSITDFIVSLALFIAISYKLYITYKHWFVFVIGFLGLIFSMLQCSYFIYYEVAFIKQTGKDTINRLLETVTEGDKKSEDKVTLFLHGIFQLIYGWQDYLMFKVDNYFFDKLINKLQIVSVSTVVRDHSLANNKASHRVVHDLLVLDQISKSKEFWYKDKSFLSISSLLSIGSHMVLIAVFAAVGKFEYYLVLNLILWNLLLFFAVFYHYYHACLQLHE